MIRVKICGLTRRRDALAADRLGADYLGVVMSDGFGRSVAMERVSDLVTGTRATKVAVLVDESPERAAALAGVLGAGVIQLHGAESAIDVRTLKGLGDWKIWKAVRADGPDEVTRALEVYGDLIDGLLVEGKKEGVVGGGGVRVDLDRFAGLGERMPNHLELVLAGGLTPDNVADAIACVMPDVVDVSSGVELELGEKDRGLLEQFFRAARGREPRALGSDSIHGGGGSS